MKLLFVGDPHAEVEDLNDCFSLAQLIIDVAKQNAATVVLAGDLYHTHAIIHAEVQYFWWAFFETLKNNKIPCIILKGNHDMPGLEGTKATALVAHIEQCMTVLYKPRHIFPGILFCPYTNGKQLIEWSRVNGHCKTLFCHQTFDGSKYDSGFYAGDGINPDEIAQEQIISGHIHLPQEFGKVWYPGAPRWKTLADANTERAIWLLDFDDFGSLVTRKGFDTGLVCRKIYHLIDTPDSPKVIPNDGVVHLDIKGPTEWIEQRKPLFEGKARIRTIKTDSQATVKVRESDGMSVAFDKWIDLFQPKHGTERTTLRQLAKERVNGLG